MDKSFKVFSHLLSSLILNEIRDIYDDNHYYVNFIGAESVAKEVVT